MFIDAKATFVLECIKNGLNLFSLTYSKFPMPSYWKLMKRAKISLSINL